MSVLEIAGIVSATILSTCGILTFIVGIINRFYYPRAAGEVLCQRLIGIEEMLKEIKDCVFKRLS
jgi:hypothetical protein